MTTITPEQALALAPDPASAKASRELAQPRRWLRLAQADQAIWGECQGSAATPYQTQVDLGGPAFKCSCPSHKSPCKHGLALLVLFASQPQSFKSEAQPQWVSDWRAARAQREQKHM